ncbi:MAG: nitroreductase [Pseudomonadales bacterium]|nr:nitroreductase [Pseudomonadales bacterium]
MNVSEAVASRKSIRAFQDKPVDTDLLVSLVDKAARAPSGGNVQPWRIYVVNGEGMTRFLSYQDNWKEREAPAYEIYPQGLKDPYRSSRFKCGEDMYALLEIPRDDKPARLRRLAENFRFFGAPAAIFCFVDKQMGPPQRSDLGMYLQTFMLLAEEAGLSTCAQEAWSSRPELVRTFVQAPEEQTIFCGIAIGYDDTTAPVNQLRTDREPLSVFARVID